MKIFKTADSQRQIISLLGYPKILAKILQKKFGRNSFLIAKWLKEYQVLKDTPSWWENLGRGGFSYFKDSNMKVLITMFQKIDEGRESYVKYLILKNMLDEEDRDKYIFSPEELKIELEKSIEDCLFDDIFFSRDLIVKITTNSSVAQRYKNKTFKEASEDYGRRNLLDSENIIISYENGWRWINAGKKNDIVAHDLSNCGSSGSMSGDPDRTILALINDIGTVKLIVTWSPNENRISGARDNRGSSESISSIYHSYILDLMKKLSVEYLPASISKQEVEVCVRTLSDGEPQLLSIEIQTLPSEVLNL